MNIRQLFVKNAFRNKTVFITGGGSGINFEIAKSFASLGANIAICSRNQDRLDGAARELRRSGSISVVSVAADVRDFSAIEAALTRAKEELGPVDVVISGAAGGQLPLRSREALVEWVRTVIDIDLVGSFNLVRAGFEQLNGARGCAIFHLGRTSLFALCSPGACGRS